MRKASGATATTAAAPMRGRQHGTSGEKLVVAFSSADTQYLACRAQGAIQSVKRGPCCAMQRVERALARSAGGGRLPQKAKKGPSLTAAVCKRKRCAVGEGEMPSRVRWSVERVCEIRRGRLAYRVRYAA